MKRAFIVHLNIDDAQPPLEIAEDIYDELLNAGFLIESVTPWASPSTESPLSPQTNTQQAQN